MTEKEKEALRLLLAGHDAKSMARQLGRSVHTINERLRDARRKLAVSSSKEAARLLRQSEAADPESVGDRPFGDAGHAQTGQPASRPDVVEPSPKRRAVRAIGGLLMLSIPAATIALLALGQSPQSNVAPPPAASAPRPVADTAVTTAARNWLTLVDEGKWKESWAGTGQSFQSMNTVEAWQSASERARVPLGRVLSRTLVSEQSVPAPPNGYTMVRFTTDFANRRGATETLSLNREGDGWKVAGIYIE